MLKDMPGGKSKWITSCDHTSLDEMFGFLEAIVDCPNHITRPLLPVRMKNRLVYATGKWQGVYFTEELKLARNLGYTITSILLCKKK